MFDEDDVKKTSAEFPRNLESLSVAELDDYIGDLKGEISRAEADKEKKQSSQDAAAAFFKS